MSNHIYEMEYTVAHKTPASSKIIRIVRQPRFAVWDGVTNSETSYRLWGCSSGSTCADTNYKDLTSAGETIGSDWQLWTAASFSTAETSNYGANYTIATEVVGVDPVFDTDMSELTAADGSTTAVFYERVNVRHTISNITHGTKGIALELKHLNFLEIK